MIDLAKRALGSFRGLAVGDALGAPVEFRKPGTFEPVAGYRPATFFGLEAGQWTDDTIMALCLADALVESNGYNSFVAMDNYLKWVDEGFYSPRGDCFDIGLQTQASLAAYRAHPLLTEAERTTSAGNGTVMRLAPAAIVSTGLSDDDALILFTATALDTHYSDVAISATNFFGIVLRALLRGASPASAFATATLTVPEAEETFAALSAVPEAPVGNGGYVVESLAAAWHAFTTTSSYSEAVLQAVNRGGDADTIAAITGQLAGAYYGDVGIPQEWKDGLWETVLFEKFTEELLEVDNGLLYSRAVDYF